MRLPLLCAEYITASYRILSVHTTVNLKRSTSPKSDVLYLDSPPLEIAVTHWLQQL
jgi:hypothetical protein